MPTIEVNGTSLYYEDTGPGSTGETIVFSHGLLWGTEMFAPQIAALRGRYRCIAWDHRGQGRSAADPNRQCIGIELVWQDAVALLDALGIRGVHFCRAVDGWLRRDAHGRAAPRSREDADPARDVAPSPSRSRTSRATACSLRSTRRSGPRLRQEQARADHAGQVDPRGSRRARPTSRASWI